MKPVIVNLAVLILGFATLAIWDDRQREVEVEQANRNMAELVRSVEQRAQRSAAEAAAALQQVEELGRTRVVRSLECHSSLCRLEVAHPGEQQYQQFMNQTWAGGSLWKGASMTYRTEAAGGASVTISYLAREGHEMPFPSR